MKNLKNSNERKNTETKDYLSISKNYNIIFKKKKLYLDHSNNLLYHLKHRKIFSSSSIAFFVPSFRFDPLLFIQPTSNYLRRTNEESDEEQIGYFSDFLFSIVYIHLKKQLLRIQFQLHRKRLPRLTYRYAQINLEITSGRHRGY